MCTELFDINTSEGLPVAIERSFAAKYTGVLSTDTTLSSAVVRAAINADKRANEVASFFTLVSVGVVFRLEF